MTLQAQIAKNLREVFWGENWTEVNLKESLRGITWHEATQEIDSLNTISALIFHINFYVRAALNVMQGRAIDSHDKDSFDCPPVLSEDDWNKLVSKSFDDAEKLAGLIETLPESKLREDFTDKKHGNYYRNLNGIIEHTYYHSGQIVLIKKILLQKNTG
jgi:hypothetical protein